MLQGLPCAATTLLVQGFATSVRVVLRKVTPTSYSAMWLAIQTMGTVTMYCVILYSML